VGLVLLCLAITACPPVTKKPVAKKPRPRQEEVREKPKEVTRPASPSPAQAMTPQRKASARLVEKGVLEFNSRNYEQAAQIFQDAVNVDASNGMAYYYLAMTDASLGQPDTALGLLDKAESLLRDDQYWMGKIEELRASLSGEKTPAIKPPPVFDQY
jgi:tetratricopeptide (TPR) repeat protein